MLTQRVVLAFWLGLLIAGSATVVGVWHRHAPARPFGRRPPPRLHAFRLLGLRHASIDAVRRLPGAERSVRTRLRGSRLAPPFADALLPALLLTTLAMAPPVSRRDGAAFPLRAPASRPLPAGRAPPVA